MPYKSEDVKYEDEKFVILKVLKGYEIYIKGATCMTRRGQVGVTGEKGLNIAMELLERKIVR